MSVWQWIVIVDLAFSGLVMFGRGCAGSTRRYGITDALGAVLEVGFLIWIVAVKL